MKFFRDLSIRWKLFGGFGIVLALTAALGMVLIGQIGSVNGVSHTLSTSDFPSLVRIKDMQQALNDYEASTVQAVLAGDPSIRSEQRRVAARDARTIDANLKAYGKLIYPGDDTRDWHVASKLWPALEAANQRLLSSTIRINASTQKLIDKLDSTQYAPMASVLSSWAALNARFAAEDTALSDSTYSSARTLGIVLLAIAIAVGMGIAFMVSRQIRRGVVASLERLRIVSDMGAKRLNGGLTKLADGDVTETFEITTNTLTGFPGDEIGDIQRGIEDVTDNLRQAFLSYNKATERLRGMIGDVTQTAHSVSASSQQMAATSEESGRATGEIAQAVGDIAQGAERQVQIIEQARHAADEVVRAVNEVADHAARTAEVTHEARDVAQQGAGAADQATEAMGSVRDSSQEVSDAIRELASKSEQIGQIVQTITGIAEQTNLLALNAAIEAARAGEQGRGFAVVAEEVRKLAEEAQSAAEQISKLIGTIQAETSHAVEVVEAGAQRTDHGVAVVEQTREAFLKIGSSVNDMATRVEQIAAAAHEITASTATMQESISEAAAVAEQSSASTQEVSASTEQTSASSEEVAATATEMATNAENLRRLVAHFQINLDADGSLDEILEAALEAHEAWNARLREAIETGKSSMNLDQASRDDCCTFGKWIHTPGRFCEEQPERCQRLHDLHEQFHTIAGGVLKLAISGHRTEAEQRLSSPEFADVQRRLREALNAAKTAVV